MEYSVEGSITPIVSLNLNAGEGVYAQAGRMSWMTSGMQMETEMRGGLFKAFGRSMAGESMFMATYRAKTEGQHIVFAAGAPGKIMPLKLAEGQSMICQKRAFLCAEESVDLSVHFRKKILTGMFGGEGFIMQRLTGPGMAFVELDGEVIEYDLAEGESLKVDSGGFTGMFEPTVKMEVERVKGVKNIFFGGEGLFLTHLTGPGKVWLQSMPLTKLISLIVPHLPSKSS